MNMSNYKVIEIENKKLSDEEANKLLLSLFSSYKSNDIYFENQERKTKIFLNNLNFRKFQKDINFLVAREKQKGKSDFLLKIFKNIDLIKSYGIRADKRVYVDYNNERKVKNRKEKQAKRTKDYNNGNANFKRENNDLPKKFVNKIICGDSLKVLKEFPDNSIDLIFTSPPYNFGLDYSKGQDDKNWKDYFNQLFKVFDECIRVLKYGGRIIVNIQPLFSDYIPSHHIISNYFLERKMLWKGEILWEKNNYNCKYTAWGSWKSPSSPYLKYTWEFLEVFAKGTLKKDGAKKNADITADEFKKWVVAKWAIAPERKMKEFGHPAMFPEGLATRAIKLFSFKNDIVLDPFNGVGTTTFVCKTLQRKFIGIDISKEYCNKAKKRIKSTLL